MTADKKVMPAQPCRDLTLVGLALTLIEQTKREIAELQAEINRLAQQQRYHR